MAKSPISLETQRTPIVILHEDRSRRLLLEPGHRLGTIANRSLDCVTPGFDLSINKRPNGEHH